jgi:hypothetical protein
MFRYLKGSVGWVACRKERPQLSGLLDSNASERGEIMRILALILCVAITGCSGGVFHVPKAEYQQQVKTLGVLPVIVDREGVVLHQDSGAIIDLLWRAAAGQSEVVVEDLRQKKGYFDVRLINEPPRLLRDKLLLKSSVDQLGWPGGYRLNLSYLSELCKDSVVDGVLLLVLQGAVHNDKRWSRNTFETLVTDYNDILGTASVVAADGRVLWEMIGTEAATILSLQYADFDEAYYNKSDAVRLKFISLSGLEKTLFPVTEKKLEPVGPGQIKAWLNKVTAALSPTLFL